MKLPMLDKDFNHLEIEENAKKLWNSKKVYAFDRNDTEREIFSVDTPPPYASASHLHVGHAMSYTQAEFIVRYQRMKGKNIFYPMGFDDNGLPTERHVEKTLKMKSHQIEPDEFRKLCLNETTQCISNYRKIWETLGISVDWSLLYSTIDDQCTHTSQASFIALYKKGRIFRSDDPVIWDTHFQSALAQADVETVERKGKMYDVAFADSDGNDLIISTTRPQFLCACVALYCNPKDERYSHLIGKAATVPIFGHKVPIKTSESVDKEFGTGLMMVCTFGDAEDVSKWKTDKLNLRVCITPDGKMNELAGDYAGFNLDEAKSKIAKDLDEKGFLRGMRTIKQVVSIAERSETPIEFLPVPQWFIRIMDLKEDLLKRVDEVNWHPEFLKQRAIDWIKGLKYEWNITRQRTYGVPFPLWKCEKCGEVILAQKKDLPVDPRKDKSPVDVCPKCGSHEIKGEEDVMDTWMTSSGTPLINSNWSGYDKSFGDTRVYPMSIRVQAHDIIRTWAFYTLVKSHLLTDSIPWKDIVISGHGQNENGKKISKRDMAKYTDADGYNRYQPLAVMEKFGSDALRLWASSSRLGTDLRYSEKDVKTGRKTVLKLWNVARFTLGYLEDFDINTKQPTTQPIEDKWVLNELADAVSHASDHLDNYNYALAKESIDKFFWTVLCDRYLEMIKERFWNKKLYSDENRLSAMWTLWEVLRAVIGLYAPFIPFVTEELYQRIYKPFEKTESIHITAYPETKDEWKNETPEMESILEILALSRKQRTNNQIANSMKIKEAVLKIPEAEKLRPHLLTLCSVLRTEKIDLSEGKELELTLTPEEKKDA
ncbi:MAG: valine--tRNA ligase [Alphaproteobacteria bacterium]